MTSAEQSGPRIPGFDIADRLRKARETAGIDQADLEQLTGVSRATISNYERRITQPKRPNVIAWAMATGVDADWLLTGAVPGGPTTVAYADCDAAIFEFPSKHTDSGITVKTA